jgi:predicted amidohydrolase YtcJ
MGRKDFGTISDGAAADMCIADIKGRSGSYKTVIEKTIVGGTIVYSKS